MKHPIIYRIVFYGVLVGLCCAIFIMLDAMIDAPFHLYDMRDAFYNGCNLGSKPLTNKKVEECARDADTFKNTLDDLDRQMDKLRESK